MKLATPLGLLGLMAIAILILIYILKPKYQDQKVSSTYIWKLSLKYKKQKMPFQWLKSSLLLIMQVAILTILTIMMTGPLFILPTKSGEKIVILESSAGMLATNDAGITRFDRAVADIMKLTDSASTNERMTVILAADDATFVVRREKTATYIKQHLSVVECSYGSANVKKAVELAATVRNENPNSEIILYTARNYEDSTGMSLKKISDNEWNASVLDFKSEFVAGYHQFSATISSYGLDKKITAVLTVDGKVTGMKIIDCKSNTPVNFIFSGTSEKVKSYQHADIALQVEDSLSYDDQYHLFGGDAKQFTVQLVSDTPRFLLMAINIMGTCDVTVVPVTTPDNAEEIPIEYHGYDLYIFDGITPDYLPDDGATWLVNPEEGSSVANIGGTTSLKFGLKDFIGTQTPLYSGSIGNPSSAYQLIMDYIVPGDIKLTEYTQVTAYAGFEKLMNIGPRSTDAPVLLCKNDDGKKTVVFGFDLQYSNLASSAYLQILTNNLLNYSLSLTTDKYVYDVGESVTFNTNPKTAVFSVRYKNDDTTYSEFPASMQAMLPGVYTITQTMHTGTIKSGGFFVKIPQSEGDFSLVEKAIRLPAIDQSGIDPGLENKTYDLTMILALVMLVLICVEWGVQYREQY